MEGEGTDSASLAEKVTEVQTVTGGNKPLHRFLRGQPKYIGIALLFFGCNEMMMGLALMKETVSNSSSLYTPFWQAALFIICGSLSIHTHSYPSKKLVTVCFSMYIVTILGGLFALVHRIVCFSLFSRHIWYDFYYHHVEPAYPRYAQLLSAEAVLFATTVCVIVLLISLSWFAKASLRSSHTQVIVRQHLTVIDSDRE